MSGRWSLRVGPVVPLVLLVLAGLGDASAQDGALPLHGQTSLRLVGVEEGQEVLTTEDLFLTSMSRFDLECRLRRRDATLDDYKAMVRREVRAFTDEDRRRLAAATATVAERLRPFHLPFPREVLVVLTSGDEEANAAYCRGRAIVLPERRVRQGAPESLASLLAHELFHILSANHEPLRRRLYALIGFHSCPNIELPEEYAGRKLTNPDGPRLDYFLELEAGPPPRRAVPVLLADVPRYDPDQGGSLFKHLKFHLLEVEQTGDGAWRPLLRDGDLVLLDPKGEPSFRRQIGANTGYIIHPDEVLADNFVMLIEGRQDLRTPELIERLRVVLSAEPAQETP